MAVAAGSAARSRLCVFDTAIATDNLGDHIIMDAVWDAIGPIFEGAEFNRIPSHRYASAASLPMSPPS